MRTMNLSELRRTALQDHLAQYEASPVVITEGSTYPEHIDGMSGVDGDAISFDAGGSRYWVLTDAEADALVEPAIRDELWCFPTDMLAECTDLPISVVRTMQEQMQERANDVLELLIRHHMGMAQFIDVACANNGRAAYLDRFDGVGAAVEVKGVPGCWLSIYWRSETGD